MARNHYPSFIDYEKEVVNTYYALRDKGQLPTELSQPTPAKLRRHSLRVISYRYEKKDEELLRVFFDPMNQYNSDHRQSIMQFDVDKFRPLIKFIGKKTTSTDENNIKLLAWLIDFNPRPYQWTQIYSDTNNHSDEGKGGDETKNPGAKLTGQPITEENRGTGNDRVDQDNRPIPPGDESKPPTQHNPSWLTRSLKKPAFYILLVVLCGGGYLLSDILTPRCMYWRIDRYVLISCRKANTIGMDTLVIPRDPDTEKLRRIMQPDTLTKNAVDRTWYVKITADSIEFFNQTGFHPVYTEKKLRPVTEYILSKYVWEK